MNKQPVGLTIVWWSEAIISIRVLLFTIPVLISKNMAGGLDFFNPENRFIVLLTLSAVFYFLTGLTSIIGFKFWKFLHFAAAVFTILLTAGSLNTAEQAGRGLGFNYFYPMIFALGATVLVVFLGQRGQTA